MQHQVLFIHGGGEDGYHADLQLRDSLIADLGKRFSLVYPQMPSEEQLPDFGWLDKIGQELEGLCGSETGIVLVGHSLGASMVLKFLSEREVSCEILGVFLLAAPFWKGDQDWVQGLKLSKGFERKLPKGIPFYFYHCNDDREVGISDLQHYRTLMPQAVTVELESGGHQFEGRLGMLATDMKVLY